MEICNHQEIELPFGPFGHTIDFEEGTEDNFYIRSDKDTFTIPPVADGEIISRTFSSRPSWIQIAIDTMDSICVEAVYFHKQKLQSRFHLDYPDCVGMNMFSDWFENCHAVSINIDLRNLHDICK